MTDEIKEEEEQTSIEHRLKEQEDKYLRLLAEMENLRKRLMKEKSETIKFAKENVICEFLTTVDNFENALGFAQSASEEVKNWATGFTMILEQFKDTLAQHGIRPFVSTGEFFDPHLHEAMETEETEEHEEGTILEEFVRGYKAGERILRAARVKVAKAKNHQKEEENNG